MNTKIFSLIAGGAIALGMASCDDNWTPRLEQEGTVSLATLSVDVNTQENLLSRSEGESVDVSNFIVSIMQGENVRVQWIYSQMPEIFSLPVGDYTVEVKSHNIEKQAWDTPYYEGSQNFSIENNAITNIGTVNCKFASLKVTVAFEEALLEHLGDDCKVTVVANDNGTLEYALNETRGGYFEVVDGSNTLVATLSGTIDGHAASIARSFTDVLPGTHYRITYRLKDTPEIPEETGSIDASSGISVDTNVTDVNEGGNIEIEEEEIEHEQRPGQEDDPVTPEDPDVPGEDADCITFTSDMALDGTLNNPANFASSAVVKIHADHAIESLVVSIESNVPGEEVLDLTGVGLANEFDVANPGDLEDGIAGLGLPVGSQVKGQTDVDFDITTFMMLLPQLCSQPKFVFTLTDGQGHTKSSVLIFKN